MNVLSSCQTCTVTYHMASHYRDGIGGDGIARMCIRLVSKPSTSQTEQLSSSFDNKLFEVSKSKLLDGAEKTKLINIMSSLEHLVPVM